MDGSTRAELEVEELTRAGWTPIEGDAGWWRDPSGGERAPTWRALEIARRDARALSPSAEDIAIKELRDALDDVSVQVVQMRLDVRRGEQDGQDSSTPRLVARAALARLKAFAVELAELRERGG